MSLNDRALRTLQECGALLENDHFVFQSGKHSGTYLNKDTVWTDPGMANYIGRLIAGRIVRANLSVEAVVGPAVGGAILAQWVTYHLNAMTGEFAFFTFADKAEGGGFEIRRGYEKIIPGKRVLVVEDNLTTGQSVIEVIEAVSKINGKVIAVAAICDRSDEKRESLGGIPAFVLTHIEATTWTPDECPLCAQGVPINTSVGHGKRFLAEKGTT